MCPQPNDKYVLDVLDECWPYMKEASYWETDAPGDTGRMFGQLEIKFLRRGENHCWEVLVAAHPVLNSGEQELQSLLAAKKDCLPTLERYRQHLSDSFPVGEAKVGPNPW